MLTALTLSSSISASVFAAEPAMDGSGATQITYQPGTSTGGDGNGNTASWTIDYPVKITLDDATVSAATGREIKFSAYNSSDQQKYSGDATIQVWLKKPDNNSKFQIRLKDTSGGYTDDVKMRLTRGSGATINTQSEKQGDDIMTNQDTQFAALTKSNTNATIYGWLIDKENAKTSQTYSTTLTWKFHSEAYQ